MQHIRITICILVLTLFNSLAFATSTKLDEFLLNLKNFSAEFEQIEADKEFFNTKISTGNFFLAKSNMLKWIYKSPNIEWFLLNGTKLYHYEQDLNQISYGEIEEKSNDIPIKWLLSEDDVNDNFTIKDLGKDITGNWFELEPIESLSFNYLRVRLNNGLIDRLEIFTGIDKKIIIKLTNIRLNQKLDPKVFQLVVPVGAETI